jgi:hypothetical protein
LDKFGPNLDKFIPGVEVEDEVVAPAGTPSTPGTIGGLSGTVGSAGIALLTASVRFQFDSSNCKMATSTSSIPVQAWKKSYKHSPVINCGH